ncbi:MAG TPA: hypothetical protein VH560_19220, partial [Polyangia bacterium]|nr:hypothetical protein [Polyangia bacterium]
MHPAANSRRRVAPLLIAFVATLTLSGAARATTCLPAGYGVPGAPGVPTWWGGASSVGRDDPRWRGAAMFNHVGDTARFQTVVDNSGPDPYLVMMWTVNADPTAGDLLYFGFYNDGGAPASSTGNVFRITRKDDPAIQDAGTPDGGVGSSSVTTDLEAFYWNNTLATPAWQVVAGLPHFPSWISNDVRLDVTCGSSGCDSWDIRLRVKLVAAGQGNFGNPSASTGGGMELLPTFKLWYEMKTVLTGGTPDLASPTSSLEFNPTVVAADPDLTDPANFADENALGGPRFPDTSKWAQASVDTTLSTCEKGVNIQSGDISVVNSVTGPAGGNSISLLGANEFHAKPTNNTGGNLAAAGVLARFRIADWNTSSFASAIWDVIPGCPAAVGGSGTVPNATQFDLTCSWTLSASERCEYDVPTGRPDGCPPATKAAHQCILVDLKTAASQIYFSSASAYRNHDFVGASEFRRDVRVDVNGLPAFAGPDPKRDVYVYIQTTNMPAHVVTVGEPSPTGDGQQTGVTRGAAPSLLKRLELPANGRVGSADAARIQKALAAGQVTFEEVEQIMPTHIAYVWHDTGKTIKVGGVERKLLRPQSSFGFFVSHDGDLTGWTNKLEGAT